MTEEQALYTLNIDYASPITRAAWDILGAAETEVVALSMARERAAYGNYHEPEEPGEYLWWILDEAHVQEEYGNDEKGRDYAQSAWQPYGAYQESTILRRYAIHLMELSIPSIPPTKREENMDNAATTGDQSAF